MIGKGHSISSTKASIEYGMNKEKGAEVVLRENIAGDTAREIAEEFQIIQSQNERCVKNTLSFMISPTVQDGEKLCAMDFKEIAKKFLKEMKLQNHQSVGIVHRDKAHTHIHVYTNRISFQGVAYKDSFMGKRSQIAADNVAKELGYTRVRDIRHQKLQELKHLRKEIKEISEKVLQKRPRSMDEYIAKMQTHQVKLIPSINKSKQLQGFRLEYKGVNLKGSEVHPSMSGGNLIATISQNQSNTPLKEAPEKLQLSRKTIQISPLMVSRIAINLAKQVIKRSMGKGIDMGF